MHHDTKRLSAAPELSIQRILEIIHNPDRRTILTLLMGTNDGCLHIGELIKGVQRSDSSFKGNMPRQTTVELCLRHSHLPTLHDYDVIDFDPQSGLIQYRGSHRLESVLETVLGYES